VALERHKNKNKTVKLTGRSYKAILIKIGVPNRLQEGSRMMMMLSAFIIKPPNSTFWRTKKQVGISTNDWASKQNLP